MAIKAKAEITISKIIDIDKVVRYYLLQSSTLAAPSKPADGAAISSKWSKTEPSYTSGSTSTLYFVDQTVMSNGALKYSEVSKSSSYEAAKEAWNKANAAQNSATSANNKIDGLQVGGRNLIQRSEFTNTYWEASNGINIVNTNGSIFSFTSDGIKTIKSSGWGGTGIYIHTDIAPIEYEKALTLSMDLKIIKGNDAEFSAYANTVSDINWWTQNIGGNGSYLKTLSLNKWFRVKYTVTVPKKDTMYASNRVLLIRMVFGLNDSDYEYYMKNIKLEKGNIATDWTPAPEDALDTVDVEYYLSTSATSLAGGSWSTTAPTWVNGKYMWSRTVKADGAGNKTYSPSQNGVCIAGATGATGEKGATGATGPQGPTGGTGPTGKGVKSIVEQYYKSTSATSLAGGSWSGTYPGWENGKYIWTRSIITYTDNATTTTTAVCVTGQKGDTGAKGDKGATGATGAQGPQGEKGATGATGPQGPTGKGIKSTAVTYQIGSSGTTVPTGTWNTSVPSVAAGQYLWTRTIITYTDNTTSTSYSVGRNGNNGATGPQGPQGEKGAAGATGPTGPQGPTGPTGKGIESTTITYQLSTSRTTAPTGTWVGSPPATDIAKPYLWTRTIITFTDKTTSSPAYSVSSTLDSLVVGGRNLARHTSSDWSEWITPKADATNWCNTYAVMYPGDMKIGDVFTISFDFEVKKFTSSSKSDFGIGFQGSVDFKWNISNPFIPYDSELKNKALAGDFVKHISKKCTIQNAAQASAKMFEFAVRCDYSDGTGKHRIRNLKLERGNVATDWSPAPEDFQDDLNALSGKVTEAETNITNNANQIKLKASQTEVTTLSKNFNVYKDSSTEMIQTANDWQFNWDKLIRTTEADVANHTDYITFQNGDIILGESASNLKLKITNDSIQFKGSDADTTVTPDPDATAWITGQKFNINNGEIHDSLKVGKLQFLARPNGNFGISIV